VTTDIQALIAEARGFTAGSHPGNARSALINDLADALEYADAEAEFYKRQFKKALEHVPPGVRYGLTAGSSDISPAERRIMEKWSQKRLQGPAGGGA